MENAVNTNTGHSKSTFAQRGGGGGGGLTKSEQKRTGGGGGVFTIAYVRFSKNCMANFVHAGYSYRII